MLSFLQLIGRFSLRGLSYIGSFPVFALQVIQVGIHPPYYGKMFLQQCLHLGFFSIPLVAITAFFTGMVLSLQTYTGFAQWSGGGETVPVVVVLSLTRELSPGLSALMLAGRCGAAMAAELATMRVNQQIDALITLSVDPLKYLILPRLFAGGVMLPVLVLIADIVGLMGSYWITTSQLGVSSVTYFDKIFMNVTVLDVLSGLGKAVCFGFIISLMGCYHGYKSFLGSKGVGNAAIGAVVSGSLLVLISNYVITMCIFKV